LDLQQLPVSLRGEFSGHIAVLRLRYPIRKRIGWLRSG
jgi:hypothetical protein